MADQTVRLKIEGDASDLRKELDQSAATMDDLASSGKDAGQDIERSVSGAEESVHGLSGSLEEAGISLGSLAGAGAGFGIAGSLDSATVASGTLQAQLGLTADEVQEFDAIAREVYGDNFGDTMGEASQVVGQVHQSLGLTGDALKETSESVFAISDAFGHLGADTDIVLEGVRNLTANFPGLTEAAALDMIADGFQSGSGAAGDLQDTLQEYPGDFARLGLNANDMFGIINAGMESGVRNTDIMADAVREMGIRISTAGDTGQEALKELFPKAEADRLIRDVTAGGEAGRDAFFTILDGLTAIEDPQRRYNAAIEIMGTRGEEIANQLPGMRDALLAVRDGTVDADGAADSLNTQYTGLRNTLEGFKRQVETSFLMPIGEVGGVAVEAATGVGTLALGAQGLGVDMDKLKSKTGGARGAIRGLGIAGGVAASIWALDEGMEALTGTLLGWADGPIGTVDDMTLALEGLATTGEIPQSVADSIAGIGDALDGTDLSGLEQFRADLLDLPGVGRVMQFIDPSNREFAQRLERDQQALENFDEALSGFVGSGNEAALAEGLNVLSEATGLTGDALDEFVSENFPAYATALDRAAVDAEAAADGADDFQEGVQNAGDAAGDAADETMSLVEQMDLYLEATQKATDPVFRLIDALESVEDAQDAYTEAVEEYGAESDEASRASLDLMRELHGLEAAALDGDLSFREFETQLDRWVASGRITEEQAGLIRDRVGEAADAGDEFEGDREMRLRVAGLEQARAEISELTDQTHFVDLQIRTTGGRTGRSLAADAARAARGVQGRASGGPVWPGEAFMVGEQGPELAVFGEQAQVYSNPQTAEIFGGMGGGSQVIQVINRTYLDGRMIAESSEFQDANAAQQTKRSRVMAA